MGKKYFFVAILLAAAAVCAFAVPRPKSAQEDVLARLDIPYQIHGWSGRSADGPLFREYARDDGRKLLFIILGAGNFHHPRVCYAASGFEFREVEGVKLDALHRQLRPSALVMSKGGGELLIIYWLCLDKKISGWAGQKMFEFRRAVLGANKPGFMVRIDVPVGPGGIDGAIRATRDFVSALASKTPSGSFEYIFGRE